MMSVQGQDGRHQQGRAHLQTDGASGRGGAGEGGAAGVEKPMVVGEKHWK